ncbi:hypothetical protein PUN28_018483 [Cardiocondyla obscurior]|uniref:Uncharacterized protein n=1 Tax=Cardiocondyla obscurior TaxID=286306 RepID=A0AAW2EHU3_9HYME
MHSIIGDWNKNENKNADYGIQWHERVLATRARDTYDAVRKSINPYTPGKYASLVDAECSCESCSRVADRFVTLLHEGLHARECAAVIAT